LKPVSVQSIPQFHRRSIRLPDFDYSQSGAYFVTICTQKRECFLGESAEGKVDLSPYGDIAAKYWRQITERYLTVELGEFVVMPNHVHGIVSIQSDSSGTDGVGAIHELPLQQQPRQKARRRMLLPKIIGWFKMNSAKQINELRGTPGKTVWQRNYYEHVIRNEESLNRIREYIAYNSTRWVFDGENPAGRPDHQELNFWKGF